MMTKMVVPSAVAEGQLQQLRRRRGRSRPSRRWTLARSQFLISFVAEPPQATGSGTSRAVRYENPAPCNPGAIKSKHHHAQAAAAGNDMKGTFAVKVCASPCAPQPPGPSAWCIARVVGWLRLSGSERGPRFVARARRRC